MFLWAKIDIACIQMFWALSGTSDGHPLGVTWQCQQSNLGTAHILFYFHDPTTS